MKLMDRFTRSYYLMFLYLSLTYIVAIRVNGEVVRLPTIILLLPLLFLHRLSVPPRAGLVFLAFIAFTLTQYLLIELTGSGIFPLGSVIKDYILYLCAALVYLLIGRGVVWCSLSNFSLIFFKSLIVVALGLWLFSFLGGFHVGVDDSYSPPRASGLMTEPANLSHFLPAFVIYSFLIKDFRWLVTSLALLGLTFSPTVFGVLVGAVLLYLFIHFMKLRVVIVISILALIAFAFVIDYGLVYEYLARKGVIGFVVIRILDGIQNLITLGEVGHNSRAALYFAGIDLLKEHGLIYTGTGFASSVVIAEKYNDGMLFDSTTLFSIFMWFGLFSLPIYLYLQWIVIKGLSHDFLSVLLMGLCVSNIITGGGVWVQMFFWSLLWVRYRDVNSESFRDHKFIKERMSDLQPRRFI